MTTYRIYCDESCHLENDHQDVMLLGCVWAPDEDVKLLSNQLKDIKSRHSCNGELKWTKVSRSRINFFKEVVDWFFAQEPLHFRALVLSRKNKLNHGVFNQGSHDTFYYKSYFSLLSKILSPTNNYQIYLDIKDSRSTNKIRTLQEILCTDKYDFTGQLIEKIQHVRSHEIELLQVADFFLGAVGYVNRGLNSSQWKLDVIRRIEHHHSKSLNTTTSLHETKFNVFVWEPRKVN